MSTHLRIMLWNVKAPELTKRGPHNFLRRRKSLVARIKGQRPDVLAITESGSGAYLLWWKRSLKKIGLRWARHGAYWQNNFLGAGAKYVAGGVYFQQKQARFHGDDKPAVWTVFTFAGKRFLVINVHPENQDGFDIRVDASAETIRKWQVRNTLHYGIKMAKKYGVPETHVILVTDGNSPSGGVKRHIEAVSDWRDAFDLTTNTVHKTHVSNNKWRAPERGERIDLVLVHMSMVVVHAANSEASHDDSDHNPQIVDLLV